MNVTEGVRRLGILLGVCGGIAGGFLGYGDAANVWGGWTAHRKFESLMATPTIQKFVKAAASAPKRPPLSLTPPVPGLHSPDFKGLLADPMFLGMNSEQRREVLLRLDPVFGSKIAEAFRDGYQPSEIRDYLYGDDWTQAALDYKLHPQWTYEKTLITANSDGIKSVTASRAGDIASIELDSGVSVAPTEPPRLMAYLLVLAYPLFGFLLPWGAVRVLAWVGRGFFAGDHQETK
jgi:hypothetical protein